MKDIDQLLPTTRRIKLDFVSNMQSGDAIWEHFQSFDNLVNTILIIHLPRIVRDCAIFQFDNVSLPVFI